MKKYESVNAVTRKVARNPESYFVLSFIYLVLLRYSLRKLLKF